MMAINKKSVWFLVIFVFWQVSHTNGQSNDSFGFLDSTFSTVTVAGVASTILDKESIEVQWNNTLSSFWFTTYQFNYDNFRRVSNQSRVSQFNQTLRIQYGFSNSNRWDLGLEIHYNWFRNDDFARSSPFRVFSQKNTDTGVSYNGLSGLGIRARYQPLESDPKLILQGRYSFPVGNHESLEKRLLNADLNQFEIGGTYYNAWNTSTYYFVQGTANFQFSPVRSNQILGAGFYLVKSLLNDLIYLYPGINYTFASQNQRNGGFSSKSHYVFAALGGQYTFRSNFIGYAIWQIPLLVDNGSIYSEIVRSSFTNVSLGLRFILN